MNMNKMILAIFVLLAWASPALAGDDKATVWPTTSESRTSYRFHSDPDAGKSGWATETDRVYNYEITDSKGNKSTARPTTSETRSYWQYHSDPDPKKSGWKFEQDRVYNYEIKDGLNKGSQEGKSSGKKR
jgi:hypothetical protein